MKINPFVLLTLSNGAQSVIIPRDNIAFAMRTEGATGKGEKVTFTRVYLRSVLIDDDAKWVDVVETPEEIAKI